MASCVHLLCDDLFGIVGDLLGFGLALCLVGIFPLVLFYVGEISLDDILVFMRFFPCVLFLSFEYITLMSCIGIWRYSWRLYIMNGRSFFGLVHCVLKIFP